MCQVDPQTSGKQTVRKLRTARYKCRTPKLSVLHGVFLTLEWIATMSCTLCFSMQGGLLAMRGKLVQGSEYGLNSCSKITTSFSRCTKALLKLSFGHGKYLLRRRL